MRATLAEAQVSSRARTVLGGTLLSLSAAVVLACVVLLTLLGHKPLTNWDEAIYAEVSREMLTTGWMAPHWNGPVWLEKPPLMLWITAAFFKLFGVNEFWARAGSALSGVATVGLLHRWLLRRNGHLAAWLCTMILLSTFGFLHVCRVGEMDVLLSLGCCVALCGLAAVGEGERHGWYAFFAGFAIAAMTKGAASVVLPLTGAVLVLVDRWSKRRFAQEFWLGLLLFVGIVLPWHLMMWLQFRRQFLSEYLGYHVLARAAHPLEGHVTQWWFYLWVMFVSAMPWVLLYPLALCAALRRRDLRAWAVFPLVVVVFFSVVRTRLPHYVAPAYPAMAVLTAVLVVERLHIHMARYRIGGARWIVAAAAVVLCGISILATARGRGNLHRARTFGGSAAPNEKEPVALVLAAREAMEQTPGPLLVRWRDPERSIAGCVFYARRPVERVSGGPDKDGQAGDRYTGSFGTIDTPVPAARIMLIDRELVSSIPPALRYAPIKIGKTMEIGLIQPFAPRAARSGEPLEQPDDAHGSGP